jgi:hypothetical protein
MTGTDDFAKLVWWEDHADLPEDQRIARVMTLGSWADIQLGLRIWGPNRFREVLKNPPAGVLDRRSWVFWHKRLGLLPVPPFPEGAVRWPARHDLIQTSTAP